MSQHKLKIDVFACEYPTYLRFAVLLEIFFSLILFLIFLFLFVVNILDPSTSIADYLLALIIGILGSSSFFAIGYYLYIIYSEKISFTEEGIERIYKKKSTNISYDKIVSINYDRNGRIKIIYDNGEIIIKPNINNYEKIINNIAIIEKELNDYSLIKRPLSVKYDLSYWFFTIFIVLCLIGLLGIFLYKIIVTHRISLNLIIPLLSVAV